MELRPFRGRKPVPILLPELGICAPDLTLNPNTLLMYPPTAFSVGAA